MKIYQEEFSQSRDHVEDLADLVSLGSISKAEGNVRCTAVLNNLDRVVEAARQLFVLAPDGDVQQLIDILIGQQRGADEYENLINMLQVENYRDAVCIADLRVRGRADIEWLDEEFRRVKVHVAAFKRGIKEEESTENAINRSINIVREDIEVLLRSIYLDGLSLDEMESGELQFLKDKVLSAEKRLNELRSTSQNANFRVRAEIDGEQREIVASEALVRASRDVYRAIGSLSERNKES